MKSLIVQKYGGSSLADAEKVKTVAARIIALKEKGNDVVVVVSVGSSIVVVVLLSTGDSGSSMSHPQINTMNTVNNIIAVFLITSPFTFVLNYSIILLYI